MPDGSAEYEGRDTTGGCVLLEVHSDRCTVRTTTNESRRSEFINSNLQGYPCLGKEVKLCP